MHHLWHNHTTTKNQSIFKEVLINAVVVVVALVRKDTSMTLCLLAIASKKRESHEKKLRPGKHSFPCARDCRDFVLG